MAYSYIALIVFFVGLWVIKKKADAASRIRQSLPYPPGPKPKPLIGNALDIPTSNAHEVYHEWGRKFQSDLLFASALGTNVLILNNYEDADELLERRARKYSDRPVIPILKAMGWEYNFAFLPYGRFWRLHRQISQQNLRAEAIRDYHLVLTTKVHELLSRLLNDPENFEEHNKMLSISTQMSIMYGYPVRSFEDPCIVAADQSITIGSQLILPGQTLLNTIPLLAKMKMPLWLPGETTWKIAARVKALSQEMEKIPFEFVKEQLSKGTAADSLVARFLRKREEFGASAEEELVVRNIAATVYGAGSDTTISTTSSFFYLLATHPEIQKKAQAELDLVIGPGRLPTFEDRPSLPYIEAIYREVLRYGPPLPVALPHRLTEDDHYKGYFIPKGTIVIGNIWAMTRDEKLYPDAHKFIPDRHLDESGNIKENERILAYGFGRRVCVGKYMASAVLWMTMASVLVSFKIEKKKDSFGHEIPISDDYDDFGAMRHKSKYQCSFVPRSDMARDLINSKANLKK